MGCISSKRAESTSSAVDDDFEGDFQRVKRSTNQVDPTKNGGTHLNNNNNNVYRLTQSLPARTLLTDDEIGGNDDDDNNNNINNDNENENKSNKKVLSRKGSKSKGSISNFSLSLKFGSSNNNNNNNNQAVVAEQTAAGWPAWLAAVAGDAIQGWVPLRADLFEKLDKIGQGTYSSVYKARERGSGRLVALKKVRFDNCHPDSVRFMAREITILRKLDHPNIIKLHGLITSKASCSMYLVFEYMEHDLAGLLSCPHITFTQPQIKCFMQQILYGLDYCHGRGVMHRDIKTSNILLNNEGVLKLADFGLANTMNNTKCKQSRPLTSRVVTLWYRPPELLLGSTDYTSYVDMWSAGCVFAELLIGKPILKGKTEVEQLHKIFKLSGSPAEEYWNKSKLPHTSMFKPQAPYESSLKERFKSFPEPTVSLLETLLSVDPTNRGTAASALTSEYFNTMPYACDPSSLPKCSPNKEIDAKSREESRRRRVGRTQDVASSSSSSTRIHRRGRKGLPDPSSFSMLAGRPGQEEIQVSRKYARRNGANVLVNQIKKGGGDEEIAIMDIKSDVSGVTNASQGDILFGANHGKTTTFEPLPPRKTRSSSTNKKSYKFQNTIMDPSSVLCSNTNMLYPHSEGFEDPYQDHSTKQM